MPSGSILSLPLGAVLQVLAPGSPQTRALFNLNVIATVVFEPSRQFLRASPR